MPIPITSSSLPRLPSLGAFPRLGGSLGLGLTGAGLLGGAGGVGGGSLDASSSSGQAQEVEPQALADPDSLFMQIDSLQVHFKLSVGGRPVIGQGPDVQKGARAAVIEALRGANPNNAAAAAAAASDAAGSDADSLSLSEAGGVGEDAPLRGVTTYSADGSGAAATTTDAQSQAAAAEAAAAAAAARALQFRHPVVLLHGFGHSLFQWRTVWADLSAQCAVLIAFDRPGFGLTSRPLRDASGGYGSFIEREEPSRDGKEGRGHLVEQECPYTAEYSQRLLLTLLDKLGIGSANPALFVGHSTGGTTALRAAIASPQRCLGLFLVSPHVLTSGFPDMVKQLLKTRLGNLIVRQLVRSEMGEVALKRAWYNSNAVPAEVIANYQRNLAVKHNMESLIEIAAAASVGADQISGRDRLANLAECLHMLAPGQTDHNAPAPPVCILHGLQDRLVDISESVRVFKLLKSEGAAVTLIKASRCGHVPHEEFPTLFLEHLFGFMHLLERVACEPSADKAAATAAAAIGGADEQHVTAAPADLGHHRRARSRSHSLSSEGSSDDEDR
jgi:pimeloyl-ACP methyl ester carboxylesterase